MTQYDIWLNRIPGMGSRIILRLWRYLNCRKDFAQELYEMDAVRLEKTVQEALRDVRGGLIAGNAGAALMKGIPETPARCLEELEDTGMQCVCICDPEYPVRLRHIPDPPFALYYYGSLPSDFRPAVGIVGTRMASPYGRDQARVFAMKLAQNGVQIVSGMARGIDGVAGKAALDGAEPGLPCSFAVLGCGADICYPKENLQLYRDLQDRGGILSEYPPGTLPEARLFPSRNRIISGLSDVVLVMEAREKSGTMITVDQALEQGKDVFALPGRISDRNSRGCNNLIRQGAGIAMSPETILAYLSGEEECEDRDRKEPRQLSFDFEALSGAEPDEYRCREQETEKCRPGGCEQAGQSGKGQTVPADRLGQAVWQSLDDSTPRDLDAILPAVEASMGRRVSMRELVSVMTKLTVNGFVREVRVGNYVSIPEGNHGHKYNETDT